MQTSSRRALPLIFALIAGARAAASAQQAPSSPNRPVAPATLRGRVVTPANAPISGADIWIISSDTHATSDSVGAFLFTGLPPGKALVQVRRVGYTLERDTVQLSNEHENVRTYALITESAVLDTVRTVANQQSYLSSRMRAFEERRTSGQGGYFISDSVLRKNENSTLGNLLVGRLPGVHLLKGMTLVSSAKQCRGLVILATPKSSCREKAVADCYVAIYLDGNLYYNAKMAEYTYPVPPPDLRREFDVSNLGGAEFYPGGAASPAGMQANDDGCGALWLWTRER